MNGLTRSGSVKVKKIRISQAALALMVVVSCIYFSSYQIQRHYALETNIDLTNIEQSIWNTLHGDFMRSTIFPTTGRYVEDFEVRSTESRVGTHVQPLLFLLLLPYAVVPRSETLLILLSLQVCLGAVLVFRIARRRFSNEWMGLLFAGGYLLLPIVETNMGWDPHGMSFITTFLLAAYDAMESDKRGWWWFWALLAMSCREDAPFLTGWAFLWMAPQPKKREGLKMFGVGLSLSLFYFLIIIPAFGGGGSPYFSYFLPLGVDFTWENTVELLRMPAFWYSQARNFLLYNLRLGLPVLFLYWLSWPALLAMAPQLLLNSFIWYEPAQIPDLYHYAAPLVPWVIIGTMQGMQLLEQDLRCRYPRLRWRTLLGAILLMAISIAHVIRGYTPLSSTFDWPVVTVRDVALRIALEQVPQEAILSADANLAAQLSQRRTLRLFRDMRDAEWVALDFWLGWDFYGGWNQTWLNLMEDPGWETVAVGSGWIILRQGAGPPTGIATIFSPPEDAAMQALEVGFGQASEIRLTAAGITQNSRVICSTWQNPAGAAYEPWLAILAADGETLVEVPLMVVRFAPQLLEETEVADCTDSRLVAGLPREAHVQFFVLDAEGQRLPPAVLSVAGAVPELRIVDDRVVLEAAAGTFWGSER